MDFKEIYSGFTTMQRFLFLLAFLSILIAPAFAMLENGNIKIFAVTEDNRGMAADLYMYTIPGTGKAAFITSNSLVGKDTQTTGNIALQIAQNLTNTRITDNDVIFDIRANASEVDGPSAGAAMALLSYSMLAEKPLNPAVALTGTINDDGSIGMVGGVGPKSVAASNAGIKLFLIPSGEAIADIETDGIMHTVNLLDYGPSTLGMKVVEVSTIEQALNLAYADINSIKIDSNAELQMFIPKPIPYSPILAPMKIISQSYIIDAKAVISDAQMELENTNISDALRADLYQRHSATKRSVEMAQRFLDQNYLYSAANYAFNARVMAGAVKEIAQNPSLLSADSTTLLDAKISVLRKEIELIKQKMDFIPSNDDFEWMVGAQQRIAYAENALKTVEQTIIPPENPSVTTPAERTAYEQEFYFNKVYDYVSAQAWTNVAEDFLKQAQKSSSKKVPVYSKEFVSLVNAKINDVNSMINDANSGLGSLDEAKRRFASGATSFDNNFYFAALYDIYFAQAFLLSETSRGNMDANKLYSAVEADINAGTDSDSVWADLFFDHAKFYFENAVFNSKLGRFQEVNQSVMTSYDLIFLSGNIAQAKTIVSDYLVSAKMDDYVQAQAIVDVTYTRREDSTQYLIVLLMLLAILLVSIVLLLGLASKARQNQFTYDTRKDKLSIVLGNLDKALSLNKISDAEYFFMKKKYEEELKQKHSTGFARRRSHLSVQELKSKHRALERGLIDLRRHFKAGLIIPEDYEANLKQVRDEIMDVKSEIRIRQEDEKSKKKEDSPIAQILKGFAKKPALKGTLEQVEQEKKGLAAEKVKRKKLLRRYAYKEKERK
jgi:uncharacterized protein